MCKSDSPGRRARICVPQIREVKAAAARVTPDAGSEGIDRKPCQTLSCAGALAAVAAVDQLVLDRLVVLERSAGPAAWTAVMWTKMSLPPSAGWMKP